MIMNLSEHFTYRELTYSSTAEANNITNTPDAHQLENLIRLCETVLEPVRIEFNEQIFVTSGFRNPILNRLVGGSNTSDHKDGKAADIKCNENGKLFRLIEKMIKDGEIEVGQLIWEKGDNKNPQWIHISLPNNRHKNEIIRL